MRGVFDEKELDQGRRPHDTELTLGPTTLLGIFFGLVLLCGLFFGLGFAVGRNGSSGSPVAAMTAAPSSSPAAGSRPKPSATASNVPQPQQQRTVVNVPVATPGTAPAAIQPSTAPAAASSYAQPAVKPALPPAQYQPPIQPPPASRVESAMAPSASLMVQIAAVSHPEDAEVLVGALRKRGYAVSVRRVPTDGLIHVQIGPFKTRDEAIRWRQRLLDDGYNAIVQQ